ncbi:MAG: hypothetical protein QJR01_00045 [Kyrpidia sp.]|nr:hypothetical protein [Kyrpidia sp.]
MIPFTDDEIGAIQSSARRDAAHWGPLMEERLRACVAAGCRRELLDRLLEAAAGYHQAVGRLVCAGLVKQFTSPPLDDTMGTERDDR